MAKLSILMLAVLWGGCATAVKVAPMGVQTTKSNTSLPSAGTTQALDDRKAVGINNSIVCIFVARRQVSVESKKHSLVDLQEAGTENVTSTTNATDTNVASSRIIVGRD